MWKVPPPGRERSSARTTVSVRPSTVSRTLADAAPCVPCTARKAFISATAILLRLEADDRAVAANDLVAG